MMTRIIFFFVIFLQYNTTITVQSFFGQYLWIYMLVLRLQKLCRVSGVYNYRNLIFDIFFRYLVHTTYSS